MYNLCWFLSYHSLHLMIILKILWKLEDDAVWHQSWLNHVLFLCFIGAILYFKWIHVIDWIRKTMLYTIKFAALSFKLCLLHINTKVYINYDHFWIVLKFRLYSLISELIGREPPDRCHRTMFPHESLQNNAKHCKTTQKIAKQRERIFRKNLHLLYFNFVLWSMCIRVLCKFWWLLECAK